MINWNLSPSILVVIFLSSLSESVTIFDLKFHPRQHDLSRSLLRRKISDSNSHPKVLNDIHDLAGCPGEICGTLAGEAVQPLLAGAAECAQQDMADKMIDMAKTQLKEEKVKNKLIQLAKAYRQTERNTFPDYSSSSPPDTNSLFCQKQPKNSELSGLVQAQSQNADPNLFFDPKVNGKSISKGSDPRTQPFARSKEQSSTSNSTSQDADPEDTEGQKKANPPRTSGSRPTETGKNDTEVAPSPRRASTQDAPSGTTDPETGNLQRPEPSEASQPLGPTPSEDGSATGDKPSSNTSPALTPQVDNGDTNVSAPSLNPPPKKLGPTRSNLPSSSESSTSSDPQDEKPNPPKRKGQIGKCRPKRNAA